MRYSNPEIEAIWSEEIKVELMRDLWKKIAQWQHDRGFKDALRMKKIKKLPPTSSHEVVDELNKFIAETNLVNLHAGLTSSDIIDNVRLYQIKKSADVVVSLLADLYATLRQRELGTEWRVPCIGYTHFQYASIKYMSERVAMWVRPLSSLLVRPPIYQKQIAGAVGNGEAMRILGVDEESDFEWRLDGVRAMHMQSSNFVSELAVAQWLAAIAAQLHKIAFDIRFLMHTGELKLEKSKDYRGSSAMANKVNPIEFERVCSLMRTVRDYPAVVWDAMAHNGLERTMDNSASLRLAHPRMFGTIAYCIESLTKSFGKLSVDKAKCAKILKENRQAATVEYRLAEAIKKGTPRLEAYEKFYN